MIPELERYAKNLNHLTLPEIKDFNALGDTRCVRYFVKRFSNLEPEVRISSRPGWQNQPLIRGRIHLRKPKTSSNNLQRGADHTFFPKASFSKSFCMLFSAYILSLIHI